MSEPARGGSGAGPMAWIHRVTIAAGLACALVYAAWEFANWSNGAGAGAAVRAALAVVAAVGIGLYLRGLGARFAAKLAPRR